MEIEERSTETLREAEESQGTRKEEVLKRQKKERQRITKARNWTSLAVPWLRLHF